MPVPGKAESRHGQNLPVGLPHPSEGLVAVNGVLVCKGRVCLVQLAEHLPLLPGYHAFPGGFVGPDSEEELAPSQFSSLESWVYGGLCQTLRQMIGYDLPAAFEAGEVHNAEYLGHEKVSAMFGQPYSVHYTRIDLDKASTGSLDPNLVKGCFWMAPSEFLAQFHRGRLLATPSMVRIMEELNANPDIRRIGDVSLKHDREKEVPCFEIAGGLYQLLVPSITQFPADRTNAFVVGDLLVDPSPRSEDHLQRLLNTLERFRLKRLLITHHHADHCQFADRVARELGLRVYLSAATDANIRRRWGPNPFTGLDVELIADGSVLSEWQGQEVKAHEIPGHDNGQIGIAPDDLSWFVVGDLIQGIGTVVIAAPEGHMATYFRTLQRVIDLDPAVIIPSHGLALGGTYRLRTTLEHRRQREAQVLALHLQNQNPEQMLGEIYRGLDPRLAPLALCNIQSHLVKLREEGRLA